MDGTNEQAYVMFILELGRSFMGAGVDGGHVCTTPGIDRRPLLRLVSLMVRAIYTDHASAPNRSYHFVMRRWPKKVVSASHQVTAQVLDLSETHQIALAILQSRLLSTSGNRHKAIPPIEEMTGCQRSFLSLLVDLPTHPK